MRRVRADAVLAGQAYDGDAGPRPRSLRARLSSSPGERAVVPTGFAVEIPEGYAGFVQPRSGLAARTGSAIVNSPGLIDSGYRGEIQVVLLNTDARSRSPSRPGCESPSSSSPRSPRFGSSRSSELATSERGARGFGSSALSMGEPRVRVSAILRWRGRILLCRHVKHGGEVWLLPGGGVQSGESLVRALQRELWEETGLFPEGTEVPLEGPVALVDSIAPEPSPVAEARRARDLRGGVSGVARGRASQDDGGARASRSSAPGARRVPLHPPIQRFLQRWQPGDPAVYLGEMWVP